MGEVSIANKSSNAEYELNVSVPTPEIPASHTSYNIDTETITPGVLTAVCKFYAAVAEKNPQLAHNMADQTIKSIKYEEDLRQQGLSDEQIQDQKWDFALEQHNELVAEMTKSSEKKVIEDKSPKKTLNDSQSPSIKPAELVAKDNTIDTAPVKTSISTEQIIKTIEPSMAIIAEQNLRASRAESLATDHLPEIEDTRSTNNDEIEQPIHLVAPLSERYGNNIDVISDDNLEPRNLIIDEPDKSPTVELGSTIIDEVEATDTPVATIEIEQPSTIENKAEKTLADFTEALEMFGEIDTEAEQDLFYDEDDIDVRAETQPIPIISAVVDRIRELTPEEEKETAPMVIDIIKVAQVIKSLEEVEETIDSEAIEIAQEELEILVVAFFDTLGINYDTQDIKEFMSLFTKPIESLQKEPADDTTTADLEHDGTREAKLRISRMSGIKDDLEEILVRVIGQFAVASHLSHTQYPLAIQASR